MTTFKTPISVRGSVQGRPEAPLAAGLEVAIVWAVSPEGLGAVSRVLGAAVQSARVTAETSASGLCVRLEGHGPEAAGLPAGTGGLGERRAVLLDLAAPELAIEHDEESGLVHIDAAAHRWAVSLVVDHDAGSRPRGVAYARVDTIVAAVPGFRAAHLGRPELAGTAATR
ncbi:MAG: hypothetical protein AB7G11_00450 [Phycisphaerales bacterium]